MLAPAVVLALALPFALTSPAGSAPRAALPKAGVVVPGKSFAGVRLGDSQAAVRGRWGRAYRLCRVCPLPTWLYTYRVDGPQGAAVAFRRGKVAAVFTLGSPAGWRTREGLKVGQASTEAHELYDDMRWKRCIGYGALSRSSTTVTTSIYTFGDSIYGFALTRPSEPVCQ